MITFFCYVPTWAPTRSVKDEFYSDLDAALSGISQSEINVLLGDMNAHVGSRGVVDDQWDGVRGHMATKR